MNHSKIMAAALALGLASSLTAQTVQTVPAGFTTLAPTSSTSYPWNTTTLRVQMCYDSSHIKSAGPVIISRLRFTAFAAGTWTGRTYIGATVKLSTCKTNWNALTTTSTLNTGADEVTAFTGNVVLTPGAHANGRWYVDIKLTTPFHYDPSKGGDLLVDVGVSNLGTGTGQAGTSSSVGGASGTQYMCARQYSTVSATATSLPSGNTSFAPIIEISWNPAKGLFSGFSASPTAGSGPLKVAFKDTTFTSAAGGVKTWAWDFDGDNVVDSKVQNPTHTYASVNKTAQYSVTLTTTDGVNPASKLTKTNFITVDPKPTVDFAADKTFGNTPLIVKFTDMSVGANKWAWDFNNDTVVDSTVQNPTYVYTKPGVYSVKLAVTGVGGSADVTKKDYITVVGATSNKGSADMLQYQFNEVRTNKVANTASTTAIPGFGTASIAAWQVDAGRKDFKGFDAGAGALGNNATVDTGWKPKVSGNMTISWWFKNKTLTGTTFGYVFGNGTFRCFTGGAAGATWLFRGSSIGDISATTSAQINVGKWVHVALVVDGTAKNAYWYFNGVLDATVPLTTAFSYDGSAVTNNFTVGSSSTSTPVTGFADVDDFRVYGSALTAAQIKTHMLNENPTVSAFDAGCLGTLGTPEIEANGAPQIGNAAFALSVTKTESGRPGVLVLGASAKKFANLVPLPLSLGGLLTGSTGCNLHVDALLLLPAVGNGGAVPFALPIPAAVGAGHVYAQWIGFGTKGTVSAGCDINMRK
jgi:PKD repeat protein